MPSVRSSRRKSPVGTPTGEPTANELIQRVVEYHRSLLPVRPNRDPDPLPAQAIWDALWEGILGGTIPAWLSDFNASMVHLVGWRTEKYRDRPEAALRVVQAYMQHRAFANDRPDLQADIHLQLMDCHLYLGDYSAARDALATAFQLAGGRLPFGTARYAASFVMFYALRCDPEGALPAEMVEMARLLWAWRVRRRNPLPRDPVWNSYAELQYAFGRLELSETELAQELQRQARGE